MLYCSDPPHRVRSEFLDGQRSAGPGRFSAFLYCLDTYRTWEPVDWDAEDAYEHHVPQQLCGFCRGLLLLKVSIFKHLHGLRLTHRL
jgi:hypothetical protein